MKYAIETASETAVSATVVHASARTRSAIPNDRGRERDGEHDVAHALGVVRKHERRHEQRQRDAADGRERRDREPPPRDIRDDEHASPEEQDHERQAVRRVHRRLDEAVREPPSWYRDIQTDRVRRVR